APMSWRAPGPRRNTSSCPMPDTRRWSRASANSWSWPASGTSGVEARPQVNAVVSLAAALIALNMRRRSVLGRARGIAVSLLGIGKRAAAVAIGLAIIGFAASSAAAQIVFGSPGDPPHIALGAGAFDVTPSHRG